MSVTGTNVIDRINNYYGDSANAIWTAAQKLEAVNAAIDAAWGFDVKNIKTDSSITLATSTREYTPTAADVTLEDGFAAAYVVPHLTSIENKIRLHRVYQRVNTTTWAIVIPYDITSAFNGKVLHLDYNARLARLSAVSGSVELPLDYLSNYALWWLSGASIVSKANNDRKIAQQQLEFWYQEAVRTARTVTRGLITKLQVTYETPERAVVNDPSYTGTVIL